MPPPANNPAPTIPAIRTVEVSPRDGLQNHPTPLPTALKLSLINRLAQAGLSTIELTSFVSPRAVPQLADATTLLADPATQALLRDPTRRAPVLVPNVKGLRAALGAGVREVAVFVSATEGFSQANIRCSVEEGLRRAGQVVGEARTWKGGDGRRVDVRGYVSCIFADPFDGPTRVEDVLRAVKALFEMGCYEVSLGDTTGVGTAADVRKLLGALKREGVSMQQLAGHFHDTYGQALANVWEAYQHGVRIFDSSVGGLGGCPFAPGAKGNVATEDVVYMFEQAGIPTGIDLPRLVEIGAWVSTQLKKINDSRAGVAIIAASQRTKAFASTKLPNGAPSKPGNPSRPHKPLVWTPVPTDSNDILILRSGYNAKIFLNRPRNGNALTTSMIASLTTFFLSAATDPSIRRIAITGSPTSKHFCTGMDLAAGSSPVAADETAAASDAQYTRLTGLLRAVDECPKVTIAGLNGPAFGGGVGLALACDIRVAVSGAGLTLSEVTLGLAPATISPFVVREMGFARAREAMLSARRLSVDELVGWGAVHRVVGQGETLEDVLDGEFTRLARGAPGAGAMVKELVRLGWRDAGGKEQESGVKELFGRMMTKGGEAEVGLKLWQEKGKLNWDEIDLDSEKVKAKL